MTSFSEIEAAAGRIRGHARVTPLLNSSFLDHLAGRRVWIKAECLQHTGSFKFRGAWNAVSSLSGEARARGVLAFSSGNHAQGVALSAREHGVPAAIIMPSDAPRIKIENTRAYGAEVILYDRAGGEDREAIGDQIQNERSLELIKPYDDERVIAGQGTVGLEIAEQAKEAGIKSADVVVCCGGGGLTSGIALALAEKAPGFTVRPTEPEGFDDVCRSLISGARETTNTPTTHSICDAIVTPSPGELTFPILKDLSGAGIVVSDEDCLRAMSLAFERLKIVIEPGGAAALAAALFHAEQIQGDDVVVVATGGNVDPETFQRALSMDTK